MKTDTKQLFKFGIIVIAIYFAIMGLIYYLAHDQLFYQDTQGYCEFPGTEYATTEVCNGVVISEDFEPGMNIIKSINVQVVSFLRENAGLLIIELYDLQDDVLLGRSEYDMNSIEDMSFVGITFDEPVFMGNHNLSFRMTSIDSPAGQAVAPLINASMVDENGKLFINGEEASGRLAIVADGKQTIWAGPHYGQIVFVGFFTIAIVLALIGIKLAKGKTVYVFFLIDNFKKYSFLISQLVGSSFKTKYKRSVLGIFWSFLNPLFTMIVQYFVFSNLFRFDIDNYHIYLLIGITFWGFFSTSISRSLWSIVRNAQLIKKVYVPKWIYVFSEIISSFIDLSISVIPLFVLIVFSGIKYNRTVWLVIIPIACLVIFTIGFGMMMAAFMVYFRDIEHIWAVVSMIWMYATPIFYSMEVLPENVRGLLKYNPLYMVIDFVRTCILKGISPYPGIYVSCFISAVIMFIVGSLTFKKLQDGFLLRI